MLNVVKKLFIIYYLHPPIFVQSVSIKDDATVSSLQYMDFIH